jgi:predicted nicotinamide N-methyase
MPPPARPDTVVGGRVYPVVAASGNAAIVAWTSGASPHSTIQVIRIGG